MKEINNFSNCHRSKANGQVRKGSVPHSVYGADDHSDQDSSTAKYVNDRDDRERKDGPGGN